MASTVSALLELPSSSTVERGRGVGTLGAHFKFVANSEESTKEDGYLLGLDGDFGSTPDKPDPEVKKNSGVYAKTNWIIRNSRRYIPEVNLHEYAHFRYFKEVFYVILGIQYTLLLVSTTFLRFVNYFQLSLSILQICCAAVALFLCVPVFALLFQHLRVLCYTLPWILSQPRESDLNGLFMEVVVDRACVPHKPQLKFASSLRKGIGIVEVGPSPLHSTGNGHEIVPEFRDQVRFLVLSGASVSAVFASGAVSIVLTTLNCVACIWSVVIVVLSAVNIANHY